MTNTIRIAIAGVGNCASSLIQGIEYYRRNSDAAHDTALGLMHWEIHGYTPKDIEVVAAIDIDRRKVGQPLHEAIFAKPNCTKTIIPDMPPSRVIVQAGPLLDGLSPHMREYDEDKIFLPSDAKPCDVEKLIRESGAEILLNYLPVGAQKATEFYARCCLNTGVSFINCMPVFIVSDPAWAKEFHDRGIPIAGDDIKAQVGATIVHRTLTKLFEDRGVKLDRTYQLNTGGNTDFLNMLNHDRLKSKRISKTDAVQSQLRTPLEPDNIHIGPSDYVPWQKDNKVCFLRMEGRGFAAVPLNIELRLSVEDSPNSGGVAIDVIRCCKIARERKIGGPLHSVCAYAMKHPPEQMSDNEAREHMQEFIRGGSARA
ncbi:MAG: inositol-3-phosphate synthase [Candidatus Aureabacteria bacterium]|nr:inositol-3-phosphate synthase [Candidatus Auribacterota bacterium]